MAGFKHSGSFSLSSSVYVHARTPYPEDPSGLGEEIDIILPNTHFHEILLELV